jgi:hypothetical protein
MVENDYILTTLLSLVWIVLRRSSKKRLAGTGKPRTRGPKGEDTRTQPSSRPEIKPTRATELVRSPLVVRPSQRLVISATTTRSRKKCLLNDRYHSWKDLTVITSIPLVLLLLVNGQHLDLISNFDDHKSGRTTYGLAFLSNTLIVSLCVLITTRSFL